MFGSTTAKSTAPSFGGFGNTNNSSTGGGLFGTANKPPASVVVDYLDHLIMLLIQTPQMLLAVGYLEVIMQIQVVDLELETRIHNKAGTLWK